MRNKFNEFTTTEQNGEKVVTAQPANSVDEPARFDGSIAERGSSEELEANWESLIGTLAESHLGEKLTIEDGRGAMDREEAVEALVEADDAQVKNEHAAHAVIEYLASEDIVQLDGDNVVLLMSYDDIREEGSSAMLNNWAAALDTCVDRIDAAVERVERNRKTLEKHVDNLETSQSVQQNYAQKKDELEQEMKAMLGGRKPSELDEGERKRFKRKRSRYHRYEAMEESIESGPGAGEIDAPEMLSNLKDELIHLKGALGEHSKEFRTIGLVEGIEDSGAREMVENFTNVVAQIGDAMGPEERMNQKEDDAFVEDLFGITESVSEADLEESTVTDSDTEETVSERR